MSSNSLSKRLRLITSVLCGVLVCALISVPQSTNAQINIKGQPGGIVEVNMNVMLYGPGASEKLAAQWTAWAEQAWNKGSDNNSCYDLDININIEFSGDSSGTGQRQIEFGDDYELIQEENELYPGYDTWYVPAKNQFYRSWTLKGSYDKDSIGGVAGFAGELLVVHEVGHLLGMDDHYVEKGRIFGGGKSVAEEGWEDNIYGAPKRIPRGKNIEDMMDERNFEEMIDTMEWQSGQDLLPCLLLNSDIDVKADNSPANIDEFIGELSYRVTPNVPLASDDLKEVMEQNLLVGSGTGSGEWTNLLRSADTIFESIVLAESPFSVEVSGQTDGPVYEFTTNTLDESVATAGGRPYSRVGLISTFYEAAGGVCTGIEHSSLKPMRLDMNHASKGTQCEFSVERSASGGTLGGTIIITVKSQQG